MIFFTIRSIFYLLVLTLFSSCIGDIEVEKLNSADEVDVDLTNSYTLNFDGTTTYGTLDTPWTPTGANWEIQIELVWDSSVGSNSYPLATNSSVTSIYIDSGGLPLLKYEGSYVTSNVSRLENNVLSTFKFSVSATEIKSYFNGVLEKTSTTTETLSVPWTVVGAHSSYSSKFKGQIRKITLTDLDDSSNSRLINLVLDSSSSTTLSESSLRSSTAVDFTLPSENSFTEI